jgi:hypothetical protein
MELILSIFGAITVTLLVVHLYDYLAAWLRPSFPRRKDSAPMEVPPRIAAKPLPESALPYDRAA